MMNTLFSLYPISNNLLTVFVSLTDFLTIEFRHVSKLHAPKLTLHEFTKMEQNMIFDRYYRNCSPGSRYVDRRLLFVTHFLDLKQPPFGNNLDTEAAVFPSFRTDAYLGFFLSLIER